MTAAAPASPRRILMIVERFPPDLGGVARSAARIAGALAGLGHQVEVLAWTRTLPPGVIESAPAGSAAGSAAGATLHRLGLYAGMDFSMQHSLNIIEWLDREGGERPFDLVWGHYLTPAGFLAVFCAERLGVASVVSARGNDVDRLMFPPGDFARLLWTLQRAGLITAVSKELAAKIAVLLGEDRRIATLPNVVDAELFHPRREPEAEQAALKEALGIAPDELVLGFSGELRHKKGLPFLLEALAEVRRARPACLLVIGEVRSRARIRLRSLELDAPEDADRLVVTGVLDDPAEVARHLRLCDVFLQPSVWDGMPNAVLEAMACALPVIGSDAGGIPELIEHGATGLLIPKSLLNHLGAAILELFEQPEEERRALAQAGRARVLERHQSSNEAEALRALLDRLPSSAS